MKIRNIIAFGATLLVATQAIGQGYSIYENTQMDMLQRQMYRVGEKRLHPSLRSYSLDELNSVFSVDSVLYAGFNKPDKADNWFRNACRNLIWDDFIQLKGDDYYVAINPMMDFTLGKDGDKKTFLNSRGFYVNGNLGKNFWFHMDLSENQMVTTDYETARYDEYKSGCSVVAGFSASRRSDSSSSYDYDFEVATGYIGFRLGKYLDFQLGKSKTFIGDGYRSLMLSDCAPAYPMFKMNATFGPVKYMFMMSQYRASKVQDATHNNAVFTKYGFTHYLDVNLGKRVTLGLFENIMQCSWREGTEEYRGIDWEYVNPFIVLMPGEFDAGSPDKVLVGMNGTLKLAHWFNMYGQFVFNEFRISELTGGNDWWANKYGFLGGFKSFNLFNVDGLDMQFEVSKVRPYTYSQYTASGSYTHLGNPLAHPLGANFREILGIMQYRHKRIYLRGQFNIAKRGEDMGDEISYGSNPNKPSDNKPSDYGITMYQGLESDIKYAEGEVAWLINPRTRLNFAITFRYRHKTNDIVEEESKHINFALRWGLKNWYHDF